MHNNFLKVEGHAGLVRDQSTGAIINNNKSEYEAYMARKRDILQEIEAKKSQQDEIQALKSDISELKSLLHMLIEKSNI